MRWFFVLAILWLAHLTTSEVSDVRTIHVEIDMEKDCHPDFLDDTAGLVKFKILQKEIQEIKRVMEEAHLSNVVESLDEIKAKHQALKSKVAELSERVETMKLRRTLYWRVRNALYKSLLAIDYFGVKAKRPDCSEEAFIVVALISYSGVSLFMVSFIARILADVGLNVDLLLGPWGLPASATLFSVVLVGGTHGLQYTASLIVPVIGVVNSLMLVTSLVDIANQHAIAKCSLSFSDKRNGLMRALGRMKYTYRSVLAAEMLFFSLMLRIRFSSGYDYAKVVWVMILLAVGTGFLPIGEGPCTTNYKIAARTTKAAIKIVMTLEL